MQGFKGPKDPRRGVRAPWKQHCVLGAEKVPALPQLLATPPGLGPASCSWRGLREPGTWLNVESALPGL